MKSVLRIAICMLIVFSTIQLSAQYSTIQVGDRYEAYTDSLKQVDYNYTFPILGQGAYKQGFDIPYPLGIMTNYIWMRQSIEINNMQLGLKTDNIDIPLTGVDFIDFGKNTNTSQSINIRPDIWIFPFLNVYGLFGYGQTQTEVNLVAPINLRSEVEQNISTAGFGVMTAFGVGPVWVSVDGNWTWNKPELLDKPVRVNVMGIRVGHTFTFKHKPERNIAIWIGGMRAKMSTETQGELKLIDALPSDVWVKRDQVVADYWYWYENDASFAQKQIADRVLTPIVDKIEDADGQATIRYGMDKQVKQLWNGIIGIQYQLNKRWMFRSEGGIIGDRKSILFSVNYRFLM